MDEINVIDICSHTVSEMKDVNTILIPWYELQYLFYL